MEKKDGFIRYFDEIRKEDIGTVGGKGANLGEMTAAGFLIPGGFVVTSDAYKKFIEDNGLKEYIKESPEASGNDEQRLWAVAGALRKRIINAKLPDEVRDAIRDGYKGLGEPERVAIRSSATAEDLEDASFAGQQETFLNVRGIEEIYLKIKDCYASLWGNRAVSYRADKGYDRTEVSLAVAVQLMVNSEKAGVLFTVDPVSKDRRRMQINSSYGLGESVVSGRVSADSFICDREGNIINSVCGSKETMIIYSDDEKMSRKEEVKSIEGAAGKKDVKNIEEAAASGDRGTKEIKVSKELKEKLSLNEDEVKKLCLEGIKIEKHYGIPMDIEWAIKDDTVYILQARAVTTLADGISEEEVQKYLSKNHISGVLRTNMSFLIEKLPDAMLPLDHGLLGAINNQKANIFREAGLEISMEPVIDDMGIMVLPPNKKRIHKEIFKIFGMLRELKDSNGCLKKLETLMSGYRDKLKLIKDMDIEKMSLKELSDGLDRIYTYVCDLAYARFKYSLFPMALMSSSMTKLLKKADKDLTSFDLYTELDYKTSLIDKALLGIADEIRKNKRAAEDIEGGISYEDFRDKYPEYRTYFDRFLEENGFRVDYNCYCIHARSLKECPDRLMNIMRPLMKSEEVRTKISYDELKDKIRGVVKDDSKYQKVLKDVETYRYYHVIREESQYMWETAYYYARQMVRRISLELFGDENIEGRIAYFFREELSEVLKKGSIPKELNEKLDLRMSKRSLAERVWEESKASIFVRKEDSLTGVCGSSGEAVGRACIINGPEEFGKLKKGDILVCRFTDPEWTPLFKLAAGVVADSGAELSHAAIVAREYGIPAVLGVGFATKDFKDGDMIKVDGTKGEVYKAG
ncbi:MAG: phosphoenolpyruvate synthase [Lachnospiraceae bacterium]|nr:phosphoenolpyruvate synthase [Lachnospiraceae bacterium]